MFSFWGVIIISLIGLFLIVLLFITRSIFSNIKVSKTGGIELSKDRRCEDHPCSENKLLGFMLQTNDNRMKIMGLANKTLSRQKKYAKSRFEEIKRKVILLLEEAKQELKESPSDKGELFFTISLKNVIGDIKERYEEDIELFDYENADEEHFLIFRRETVLSIPEIVKNSLPSVHILSNRLFARLMEKFRDNFKNDFAPIVEDIADKTRKFALENKSEREYLENELKGIVRYYTEEKK